MEITVEIGLLDRLVHLEIEDKLQVAARHGLIVRQLLVIQAPIDFIASSSKA